MNISKKSAQAHIYPDDISFLKIVVPTKDILEKFSIMVDKIELQIEKNINESNKILEFADWSISKIINGLIKLTPE